MYYEIECKVTSLESVYWYRGPLEDSISKQSLPTHGSNFRTQDYISFILSYLQPCDDHQKGVCVIKH